MAKYTVELRELMNNEETASQLNIALSKYPLFKSKSSIPEVVALFPTREELNRKLLNHYKYREIGFETVGRFLDELEIAMDEIMPRYNQLYETMEIMGELDNPFDNSDITETYSETRTGSGSSSSSAEDSSTTTATVNTDSKALRADQPANNISKTASEIDDVTHADEANWNKNSSSDKGTSSGSSSTESSSNSRETVEHTFTKKGNQGVNTYAHDMIEFRTSIIDVTMQIVEDRKIQELFMMVY